MNRSRRTSQLLPAIPTAAVLASGISCGSSKCPDLPSDPQRAQIYAAVVREMFSVNAPLEGYRKHPILYVLTATDDRAGGTGRSACNSLPLPLSLQSEVSSALADLPSRISWLRATEEVIEFDTKVVGDGGAIMTLGNIWPQPDGAVWVAVSIYVAPDVAEGRTYVLKSVAGVWTIIGLTGGEWMS